MRIYISRIVQAIVGNLNLGRAAGGDEPPSSVEISSESRSGYPLVKCFKGTSRADSVFTAFSAACIENIRVRPHSLVDVVQISLSLSACQGDSGYPGLGRKCRHGVSYPSTMTGAMADEDPAGTDEFWCWMLVCQGINQSSYRINIWEPLCGW